jgi:prefoldin subunit 5
LYNTGENGEKMTRNFDGLTSSLSLNMGEHEYPNTLENDVTINDDCLDVEFLNQPERFAWWSTYENLKRAEVTELKNELAELDARLGFAERIRLKDAKIKSTERMIEEHIVTHTEHKAAQQKLLDAQKELGQGIAGRQAMEHRKEMLISLGANYRAEGQADPVILREEARRKAIERARLKEKEAQDSKRPPAKRPPKRKNFADQVRHGLLGGLEK